MDVSKFKTQGPIGIARLTNFLLAKLITHGQITTGTLGDFPNAATARVARFIASHLGNTVLPAQPGKARWPTYDALAHCVRTMGPTCSEDDLQAAIGALPDDAVATWLPTEPNYEG